MRPNIPASLIIIATFGIVVILPKKLDFKPLWLLQLSLKCQIRSANDFVYMKGVTKSVCYLPGCAIGDFFDAPAGPAGGGWNWMCV